MFFFHKKPKILLCINGVSQRVDNKDEIIVENTKIPICIKWGDIQDILLIVNKMEKNPDSIELKLINKKGVVYSSLMYEFKEKRIIRTLEHKYGDGITNYSKIINTVSYPQDYPIIMYDYRPGGKSTRTVIKLGPKLSENWFTYDSDRLKDMDIISKTIEPL